jgi:hypothetical protein
MKLSTLLTASVSAATIVAFLPVPAQAFDIFKDVIQPVLTQPKPAPQPTPTATPTPAVAPTVMVNGVLTKLDTPFVVTGTTTITVVKVGEGYIVNVFNQPAPATLPSTGGVRK